MGFAAAVIAALALWIVLWAVQVKALDAFIVALGIMLVAVTVRMLASHMPGNRG